MNSNSAVAERPAAPQAREYVRPRASLATGSNGYVLRIEMPGVSSEGLDVSVENYELTVHGRRNGSTLSGTPIYTESHGADYRRVFELDPSLDTNKIEAKLEQGVLTLTLQKAEDRKPRKIQVQD